MLSYRKELDGLRAIAVVAVIIYHSKMDVWGIPLLQGGFFGVDIFFVLSGYLITSIIKEQMDQGIFTFRDFYLRRAKRIIPALLLMLVVTTGVAYLIMLPDDLTTFAKSLKSSLYLGSNHFFYNEDSYTAAASMYRPLLHTWSLSVEWQFYVLFPFVVWLCHKYNPNKLLPLLTTLTVASFIAAIVFTKHNPDFAFYLLPTRAWELLLGGMATFYTESKNTEAKYSKITNFLPKFGIALIMFSMVFVDHNTEHPSFVTLAPVVGTILFILFAREGELSFKILTLPSLVYLGAISYSLYLWHQPIFVFFRLIEHDHIGYIDFVFLTALSGLASVISYKLVESTYRKRKVGKVKVLLLFITLSACISFSHYAVKNGGFPSRFNVLSDVFMGLNDKKEHKIDGLRCHSQPLDNACKVLKDKNLILVGDSHAGGLGKHIYQATIQKNWGYTNLTPSGCIAINTVITKTYRNGEVVENQGCADASNQIAEYLENPQTPRFTIVYMTRLPLYLNGSRFDNKIGGIELGHDYWVEGINDVDTQKAITSKLSLWASLGHELVLVYPVPEMGWNVPKHIQKQLSKYTLFKEQLAQEYKKIVVSVPYDTYVERAETSFSVLDKVKGDKVKRVYPHKIFCDFEKCSANDNSHLYYYDDNHLSTHGAKLLVDEIVKLVP